jgi:hypothetical protein
MMTNGRPPLPTLCAFEAAARLGTFARRPDSKYRQLGSARARLERSGWAGPGRRRATGARRSTGRHRLKSSNVGNLELATVMTYFPLPAPTEMGEGPAVVLCHGFPETWYAKELR